MYRMYSKIRLTGTTQTGIFADPNRVFDATADWFVPHAFQVGVAYSPNERLLLALEGRMQFHGAPRTGNRNQTVVTVDPTGQFTLPPTVVAFGWRNAFSVKFGAEYRFPIDLLAIRGGLNLARSATTGAWAQYFTPPPGFSGILSTGLGFYWDDRTGRQKDKYMLDVAGAFSFSGGRIGNEYIGTERTIPGTTDTEVLCSADQVVRTGCPGDLGVFSYFITIGFTLMY